MGYKYGTDAHDDAGDQGDKELAGRVTLLWLLDIESSVCDKLLAAAYLTGLTFGWLVGF